MSRAPILVAAVVMTTTLAAASWAQPAPAPAPTTPAPTATPGPTTPAPSPEPTEPLEIDIITEAGEHYVPPKYEASIRLSDKGPRVRWNPDWRPFGMGNFIGTGLMIGVAIGTLALPPDDARWTNENSFDGSIRGALRASSRDGRFAARDVSDVLLMLSINQILVDPLVVTWWGHDAGSVALQMALMNIEAMAFNAGLNGLVAGIASRERPYRDMCVGDAATELKDCRTSKRYRSFYSGHTSTAFTAAGLTCMHHAHLPLYGGGIADALICVGAYGMAAATGAMRVVGDQHWGSDVLVGAAMGTFSGLAVPWFFHYRTGELPDASPDSVSINLLPTPTGGMLTGAF